MRGGLIRNAQPILAGCAFLCPWDGQSAWKTRAAFGAAQHGPVGQPALHVPHQRDDVVNAVLYLASDLASFLTGVTIDINGGLAFA